MNIQSVALTSIFVSLNVICMQNNPTYAIAHTTDLQYGKKAQDEAKEGHAKCIQSVLQSTPSLKEAVVTTGGDQIEGQLDGGECGLCAHYCCCCGCCCPKGKPQTINAFKSFIDPLEKIKTPKTRVLLCPGNHEFNDPTMAMLERIKKRHGNLYYTTNLGPILIIVGAVYFDDVYSTWAQKDIEKKQQALCEDNFPIVTVNHFNPVGDHDAWYKREHDAQFAKVLEGKNVIRLWGHNHSTYKTEWQGHPGYCGGGKEFITLGFDAQGNQVSESAFTPQKQPDDSYTPQACAIPAWVPESAGNDTFGEQIEREWNENVVSQHWFDTHR